MNRSQSEEGWAPGGFTDVGYWERGSQGGQGQRTVVGSSAAAGRRCRGVWVLTLAHPAEFPFNQSPVVTRSCSRSCMATDPDSIGAAHLIYCCFRDLCNSEL